MSAVQTLVRASAVNAASVPLHRNTGLQLNTNVDEDGAFIKDKVLKSGWLQKRNRKTKGWKRRYFVLRADRLSCYKDATEYKVHRQIYLSDVTAIATLKSSKHPNIFGIFSESRNYHFRAGSPEECQEWVDLIRNAAKVEESADCPMSPLSPTLPDHGRLGSSASENPPLPPIPRGAPGRMSTCTFEYSGAEIGSEPSLSDARLSQLSLNHAGEGFTSGGETDPHPHPHPAAADPKQPVARNDSGLSLGGTLPRVIWHGYLYCLKSKGGVKQWKKYWVVVKTTNLAFYKNEDEYRAIKILPLDTLIDAAEIDPLSKSKKYCLQLISEKKTYRFAAPTEDELAKALGAMKSALAKCRRDTMLAASPAAALP